MIKTVLPLLGKVVLSFWLVQNLSYEQMTKRGNGKKDSEQVGMTEGMAQYSLPGKPGRSYEEGSYFQGNAVHF